MSNPVADILDPLANRTMPFGLPGPGQTRLAGKVYADGSFIQGNFDIAAVATAQVMLSLKAAVEAGTAAQKDSDEKIVALGGKVDALNANLAKLIELQTAANATAEANLKLAQSAAASTDVAYAKALAVNAPQTVVKAGANGAILTSVAAACVSVLGVIGSGSGMATWFYADTQSATSGTNVGILPFAGNDSNSAFLKAAIPAGKYLMVSSNTGSVSASCTVRQL